MRSVVLYASVLPDYLELFLRDKKKVVATVHPIKDDAGSGLPGERLTRIEVHSKGGAILAISDLHSSLVKTPDGQIIGNVTLERTRGQDWTSIARPGDESKLRPRLFKAGLESDALRAWVNQGLLAGALALWHNGTLVVGKEYKKAHA